MATPIVGQPAAGAGSGGLVVDNAPTSPARPTVQVLPLVGSALCFTLAGTAFVWLRRRPGTDDPDLTTS